MTTDVLLCSDDLGPAKTILVREPRRGLKAALVVDNVACGPSIGGLRMAPDVSIEIRADNVNRPQTKLVLQGANIPFTPEAEKALAGKGVIIVPDFIANAGGVICAAMEYAGATRAAAFDSIAERVRGNTERVLADAKARGVLPRQAAEALASERVRAAMSYRRFSIF